MRRHSKQDLSEAVEFTQQSVNATRALQDDVDVIILFKRLTTLWNCLYTRQYDLWGDDNLAPQSGDGEVLQAAEEANTLLIDGEISAVAHLESLNSFQMTYQLLWEHHKLEEYLIKNLDLGHAVLRLLPEDIHPDAHAEALSDLAFAY